MFDAIRKKLKVWFTVGVGTVAAVLVAGLLGAFGALPKPPVPLLPAGNPIETGQWLVAPRRAYVAGERIYDLPVKPDQQALVLEADMTNRTAESSKDYFNLFQVAAPLSVGLDMPFVVLVRDARLSPELQPGMTERMAYVWMLPKSVALPADLSFAINTQIYKRQDNLYGMPGWFNEHELGRVSVPVKPAAQVAS